MPLREMRSGGRPVMSSPLNRMRPALGRRTPVRQLKNVLLPAPFGPMTARISPRRTAKSMPRSASRPPKRMVRPSVARMIAGASSRPAPAGASAPEEAATGTGGLGRQLAGRREQRLVAGHRGDDVMLAALDLEDELLREGLVILFAHHLFAGRKVIAQGHAQPFERVDQPLRVLATAEAALLHAELQAIDRLVVRLHIAVGQRTGGVDCL